MSLEHGRPDDFDGTILDDRLYTRLEAAKILGLRPSALEQDVSTGRLGGIPIVRMGHLVRYTGRTLKRIMREREEIPPGAPR